MSQTAIATATAKLLEARVSVDVGYYLAKFEQIPGGLIIVRYIRSSYKDDPLRSLFEFALFLFAIKYFLSLKSKENKSEIVKFSPREVDELIDDWEPEPIVEPVGPEEAWRLKENVVKGANLAHIDLVGRDDLGKVANLSSMDFLNLNESPRLKDVSKTVVTASGVGACGPPNFYGTQDVHVRLEEDLSRYLGTEQAILYGQDFVTAGLVILAFLKRGDLAVVDLGVNVAIQKALIVSRCDIEWYDHNDTAHLEQILAELEPILAQKPLRRRFVITEGYFAYSGETVDLPGVVALKNKYKYRLFLDESLLIGALGATGKGVCELYDVPRLEIAITIGSLATSFASLGGFCVGVRPMVHHQRINSIAYVFSASLPPYSARAASEAISIITHDPSVLELLRTRLALCYKLLETKLANSPYLEVVSSGNGPIIHLAFKQAYRDSLGLPEEYGNSTLLTTGRPSRKLNAFSEDYNAECFLLQRIIDQCLEQFHVLVNRNRIVYLHESLPVVSPHLWIHMNAGLLDLDIETAVDAVAQVSQSVCGALRSPADLALLQEDLKNSL